ncbi:MAG: cupin domain-containing protein [Gammaproteobacteria bacterium]|nr:cupin domain-containing protein [Gammaproteobacteria bacterium]MCW8923980.1 cupin domain-containing protein [Gammaproteobacteria bacterium]
MKQVLNPLGDISPETFMAEYWQKKPLLIRQAFPDFKSPVTPDELAGLACEEEVNSRIVMEKDGEHPWFPMFGPMSDEIYANMPETHWTLVVNDLEKYLPELSWIIDRFRFIPEWRLDDLMISYAADQGSVGPHIDLYDVFILQGMGNRRWQINSQHVTEENQIKETPLRIQKEFKAEEEWVIEPGDMLYLPPGVSHHGVSLGESLSYSIGFRATSHADLVNEFIGYITQDLSPQLTYQDPDQRIQQHSNEIKQDALERVTDIFRQYLKPDHPELQRWFGCYMSDTKASIDTSPEREISSIEELKKLASTSTLNRHPASRFAFAQNPDSTLLFIDGEDYEVNPDFAKSLCRQREIDLDELVAIANSDELQLMVDLYNGGKVYFESD